MTKNFISFVFLMDIILLLGNCILVFMIVSHLWVLVTELGNCIGLIGIFAIWPKSKKRDMRASVQNSKLAIQWHHWVKTSKAEPSFYQSLNTSKVLSKSSQPRKPATIIPYSNFESFRHVQKIEQQQMQDLQQVYEATFHPTLCTLKLV